MSSRKHRLVGADKESRFWSQQSGSNLQVVPVVPFDSMLKLVGPDWLGSVSTVVLVGSYL